MRSGQHAATAATAISDGEQWGRGKLRGGDRHVLTIEKLCRQLLEWEQETGFKTFNIVNPEELLYASV